MPLILILMLFMGPAHASMFGEEIIPLVQLVTGQLKEIKTMAEGVNAAKDQVKILIDLNQGIEQVVGQIQSIQAIIDRAKDLDPTVVRSMSDLNDLLRRAKDTQAQIEDLMILRSKYAGMAIEQSALQSDTSYKMGQEMIQTGSVLAQESQTATPGRASQISAATSSAQMLAEGVQLQTLSHLVQLQAMSLELQRSQIEKDASTSQMRRVYFQSQLKRPKKVIE